MKELIMMPFLIVLLIVASCGTKTREKDGEQAGTQKYTCPMHPQIVEGHPGTCPICKMDLVPLNQQAVPGEIELSESQIRLANIRTVKVGLGEFGTKRTLNARIVSNQESVEVISSKFPGRIDALLVKEPGVSLSAGQPLFRVYSEQLLTLQEDYLLQVKQAAAFPDEKIYKDLLKAALRKLQLFGYSARQVNELRKRSNPDPLITVYAPSSGVVKELNVQEGQYVTEGMPLMRLEDYSSVWVEADLYPEESADAKLGAPLGVFVPGIGEQRARISFVAPQLGEGNQILRVRAVLKNPAALLQPGMTAQATLGMGRIERAVRIPLDGVIRDEKGAYVWVMKENHKFVMRTVETGAEDDRSVVVTSGLSAGENVVISGAYLLYSEQVLKKGLG
ncbi:efflux RND transporter periplasmic adaptor subunit [Arcticibacter sp. MXS-1]|uniref:efflux RND transporter periplasmic adaptor subunit n=1 Tax=Arcticibacter sp. MXS-1 TaxID=3341726 RepID=UPI0035A847B2